MSVQEIYDRHNECVTYLSGWGSLTPMEGLSAHEDRGVLLSLLASEPRNIESPRPAVEGDLMPPWWKSRYYDLATSWFAEYQALVNACLRAGFQPVKELTTQGARTTLVKYPMPSPATDDSEIGVQP